MSTSQSQTSLTLPKSTMNLSVNLLALIFSFVTLYVINHYYPDMHKECIALLGLLLVFMPVVLYDLLRRKVFANISTGLDTNSGPVNWDRIAVKICGFVATFILVLTAYAYLPIYHTSPKAIEFYGNFFQLLRWCTPFICVGSLFYFYYIDRRQKNPHDGYWHMGCLLVGRWTQVNRIILLEYARGWFIKAFFTPIMYGLVVDYFSEILSFNFSSSSGIFYSALNQLLDVCYLIDVIYGTLGYILTLRILDTHNQSTEPTLLGWLACLSCYYPFSFFLGADFLKYENSMTWQYWLGAWPWACYLWGIAILFFSAVYALATVAFGYRMSNLTYRGIITSGPYRFTKHPAYVSKVLTWWMISLPFLAIEGPFTAIFRTTCLIVMSLIYFLRAKTEENHLSNYPEYVQYAKWIDEYGLLRGLKKVFPIMKYSQEQTPLWKSIVWFKQLQK